MFIRLPPNQVPMLWAQIKFAASKADGVGSEHLQDYLNRLLASLLDGKTQCLVRLSDDRQLQAIILTKFAVNTVTGDKELVVDCLYSFESVPQEQLRAELDSLKKFAIRGGCSRIVTYSNHPGIFKLVESLGFVERCRYFELGLEEV